MLSWDSRNHQGLHQEDGVHTPRPSGYVTWTHSSQGEPAPWSRLMVVPLLPGHTEDSFPSHLYSWAGPCNWVGRAHGLQLGVNFVTLQWKHSETNLQFFSSLFPLLCTLNFPADMLGGGAQDREGDFPG